jgi:Retron-type reverse transcriptase
LKRYGNLFEEIISFENLYIASQKAFRGKKDRERVAKFYFNLENELLCIREELLDKTYLPMPLRIFHIYEPKEREIGASDFRDRVVHHAICNKIESILDQTFISHSYACRKGKGTHGAILHAQVFSRKYSYFLKCDISKYFASIDHEVLKRMLAGKFKDPDLLWLLYLIINSYYSESQQKGIPIGSLTSQLFANMYLDRLDHYIKDVLKVKAYLRYMDDFIIFADDKAELHLLHAKIRTFLRSELRLEMKEKEVIVSPVTEGIPFLGFRIFPSLIRLKHENKKRTLRRINSKIREFKLGILDEEKYCQSLMSSTEHLKTGNTYRFRKEVFFKMFF